MNEVKEVCTVMFDEPEPPLRAGGEVWSQARRATRRRDAHRLIGVGGAGLTVVAVALAASVLAGPGTVGGRGAGGGPGNGTPVGPAPANRAPDMVAAAQRTLPDAPTPEQLRAHGDQIFQTLLDAVPSGYQAQRRWGEDTFPLWSYRDEPAAGGNLQYVAIASVVLRADGREGALTAFVSTDRRPAPSGDLCSPAVGERVGPFVGPELTCQVITIGGLPMRVTTHHDPEELEIVTATWFVRNGFVSVSATQGLPKYPADTQPPADAPTGGDVPEYRPPLTRPVFTPQHVAAIAANPALLP